MNSDDPRQEAEDEEGASQEVVRTGEEAGEIERASRSQVEGGDEGDLESEEPDLEAGRVAQSAGQQPRRRRDFGQPSKVVYFPDLDQRATKVSLENLLSPFGPVDYILMMRKGTEALVQFPDEQAAGTVVQWFNRYRTFLFSKRVRPSFSKNKELDRAAAHLANRFETPSVPHGQEEATQPTERYQQSVLLVIGINPEIVTCDLLFNLFSCYGDVSLIKILRSKQDHALIQMVSPDGASNAVGHLRNIDLFGQALTVQRSRLSSITLSDGDIQEGLARHYGRSSSRFTRNPEAANRYMTAPTPVLYVTNLPGKGQIKEDAVSTFFADLTGNEIKQVQMVSPPGASDRLHALVQFPSVGDAVKALVLGHNNRFFGRPIKVSFSTTHKLRDPTVSLSPNAGLSSLDPLPAAA